MFKTSFRRWLVSLPNQGRNPDFQAIFGNWIPAFAGMTALINSQQLLIPNTVLAFIKITLAFARKKNIV
jgi:hypothetical protein